VFWNIFQKETISKKKKKKFLKSKLKKN